jgi:hypothetical protein
MTLAALRYAPTLALKSHASSPTSSSAYLVGAWLSAGATTLVWQLSFIPLAALTFHASEFTLLLVAWRDHQSKAQLLEDAG